MNAVEHIVESYYRYILNCFTVTDVKVKSGQGRQLDVLAFQPKNNKFFHIECSVTHIEKWNPHAFWLTKMAEYKFCGYVRPKPEELFVEESSDEAKHLKAIQGTYTDFGAPNPSEVERVWCTWTVQDMENLAPFQEKFKRKHGFGFHFLSFRDVVLPAVEEYVGTANYDDDILRTLSLVRQMDIQRPQV